MRTNPLLLAVAIFIAGCSDRDVSPIQPEPAISYVATFDSISITDEALLQLSYSWFKFPPGFYQENLAGAGIYYENTLSIIPLSQRTDHSSELSTNSRDQALAWSESTSVNSAYYRTLESERQTDKYYEFRRVYQQNPIDVVLSRVHKLSYIDRSMFDSFHPTPLIGVLNLSPIDTSSVRTLTEYLWFTQNYSTHGAKALAAVPAESPDSVKCALYPIQIVYGDFGVRDQISLYRQQYSVERQTGSIVLNKSLLRTVQGRTN